MMEYSIESTIEKIKLQETDKESKLRERRTYEETIVSLNRGIRVTSNQVVKLKQEYAEATARVDEIKAKVSLERITNEALTAQLDASTKQLQIIKKQSEQGISSVWDKRFTLSAAVHEVSNKCDIWALFLKPKRTEMAPLKKLPAAAGSIDTNSVDEQKLQALKQKLFQLQAERDKLNNEPDAGEEFKRIRNALRYSTEMTINLRNQ